MTGKYSFTRKRVLGKRSIFLPKIRPAKPNPGKLELVENEKKRNFKIAEAKVGKI